MGGIIQDNNFCNAVGVVIPGPTAVLLLLSASSCGGLDLSPGDANLSARFALAGYRIYAAAGFDAQRHKSWKVGVATGWWAEALGSTPSHTLLTGSQVQHTDAAVYPGDAALIMANPESAAAVLSGLSESHTPRIVTISASRPLVDPIMNQEQLDPCKLCGVVARSSIVHAGFIVLILPRSALGTPDNSGSSLTYMVDAYLEAGYCVTLRAVSPDSDLLLAALRVP